MTDKKTTNLICGAITGLATYAIIGKLGLYTLQASWADYAIHSKDKSYTLEMYLSRLAIGILASMAAGIITTKIADDKGKSAWLAGIIVFCIASYIHLLVVWSDYPVWYHFTYLTPIIPITGLSHNLIRNKKNFE